MATKIEWSTITREWERYWRANANGNVQEAFNKFWTERGGRDRYFYQSQSGIEMPRSHYPPGDDGVEMLHNVDISIKGQPSLEPIKPAPTQQVRQFPLPLADGEIFFQFGSNVKILHCAEDRYNEPSLDMWVQDDDTSPRQRNFFRIIETGQDVPEGYTYISTVVMSNRLFVWHVYRMVEQNASSHI
ncbi:gp098 [Rhodococcus phage ReqiPoco6]|uniref:Gp098 n=1 Tax=Rhodococcus phage ReqiPoco6 TaxID=691964 RepID=D4P7W6_9CAUD|nr:gp098 [Rhodococcus phage ReqiPoco6]ADD81096.1 gp098 [Rhodococcus phage ReqiPoco6]